MKIVLNVFYYDNIFQRSGYLRFFRYWVIPLNLSVATIQVKIVNREKQIKLLSA